MDTPTHTLTRSQIHPPTTHTQAPWGEGAAHNYEEVGTAVPLGIRVLD